MNENDMQHGEDYSGQDVSGWWVSEKFDGCRVYWDGEKLWSRGGIDIQIPDLWKEQLPDIHLDCELYDGIDGLYRCSAAIKYGNFTDSMGLIVFDAPSVASNDWRGRMLIADEATQKYAIAKTVIRYELHNIEQATMLLKRVKEWGGEGLVLRKSNIPYAPERTRDILKLKYVYEVE